MHNLFVIIYIYINYYIFIRRMAFALIFLYSQVLRCGVFHQKERKEKLFRSTTLIQVTCQHFSCQKAFDNHII